MVTNGQLLVGSFLGLLPEPQIEGKERDRPHHGIGEHIDNDMRHKPRTLKGGHQGLAMNLGLEEVDAHKDHGHQRAEPQHPRVSASGVEDNSDDGQEERIPQAGFAHGPHGWTLQAHPQANDEDHEYERTYPRNADSALTMFLESQESACCPAQSRDDGIYDKRIPTHTFFFLCPTKNIITPPIRIIHMAI